MFEQKTAKATQTSSVGAQQSATLLRYFYSPSDQLISISLVPSLYHRWNQKSLKHTKKYFDTYGMANNIEDKSLPPPSKGDKVSLESLVLLARNKRKSTLKTVNPKEIWVKNRVSYKTHANNIKLVPAVHSREDILIRLNNKRDELAFAKNSLRKGLKFRVGTTLTRPG